MKKFDIKDVEKIAKAGFRYRLSGRSGPKVLAEEAYMCDLVPDNGTTKSDGTVYGATEEEAVHNAALLAAEINPSLTPKQMVEKLAKIEAENTRLKKAIAGETDEDEDTGSDEPDEDVSQAVLAADGLSREQIVAKLEESETEYDKRLGRERLALIAFEADLL